MTTDYIVASLPALAFGDPAPMEWGAFEAIAGGRIIDWDCYFHMD